MKTYKQIIEESMASKLVQTKLGNMERMRSVEIPSHEERRAQMEKRKKDAEAAAAAKAQKTSLKEDEDEYSITDFSLEELQEYIVSEEFEQLDELSQLALETHINKLQKGEV